VSGPGREPATVCVALGSNLGDRIGHLCAAGRALAATPGVEVVARSEVHETEPVGGPPQDPYLNAVLKLRTTLGPAALLHRLLAIEAQQGRTREGARAAPRTLDLDLLDYAGCTLHLRDPELELPHPRLHRRAFVLEPLAEVAPEGVHPVLGETYATLARRVRDPEAVRTWSDGPGRDRWRSWP